MKLKRLNAKGFSHDVVLMLVVVMFAIGGVAYLVASHADPLDSTAQVSGLQVLGSNSNSVSLKWTPVSGATGYNVYRNKKMIGQTKAYTASYFDTGLKKRIYNYSVSPIGSSVKSAVVQANLRGQKTIAISQCGSYHFAGNYVLTADLTGNSTCLQFDPISGTTPVNGVNLDCQGHTITGDSVVFQHINNSIVNNCNISGDYGQGSSLFFVDSANDSIENNTFALSNPGQSEPTGLSSGPYLDLYSVNNSVADNNTFTGAGFISLGVSGSASQADNNEVNNNQITSCTAIAHCGKAITIIGSNNTVAYNTITGNGGFTSGKTGTEYGTEEGIVTVSGNGTDNPTYINDNNTLAYNNINDVAYYGVEFGMINNDDNITYNQITGAATSGFGNQITPNSMTNDNFNNNTVTDSTSMFDFSIGSIGESPLYPGMTTVAFTNNTFDTNTYTPGTPSETDYYIPGSSSFNFDVPQGMQSSDFSESNDVFKNNVFDTSLSADPSPFTPASAFVDGGNNQWCPNIKGFSESSQCSE